VSQISLIVAVAENGVIGGEGGMPWRVKADLRRFRALTMGKPLVMGRKNFESIGRVLDGRDNIVVTHRADYAPEGAIVAHSLDEGLAVAEKCAEARGVDEIFVVGGGEVYRQALPFVSRLYVTHIATKPEGDVVFAPIGPSDWVEVSREPLPSNEGDSAAAVHVVYERRK